MSAPQNLTATADATSVSLDWDPPSLNPAESVQEYRIYEREPTAESVTQLDTTTTPGYTHSNLENGEQHAYYVTAYVTSDDSVTWETAADWDAAQTESNVVHGPNGQLTLGLVAQSFEGGTVGGSPNGWDTTGGAEIDDARAFDGSYSLHSAQSDDTANEAYATIDYAPGIQETTIEVVYNESSSNAGGGLTLADTNGNEITTVGTDNPPVYYRDGNGAQELVASPSPEYDTWRRFTVTLDWSADEFDVDWLDETGGGETASATNRPFVNNNATEIGQLAFGDSWTQFGSSDDIWIDVPTSKIDDSGSLTTAAKGLTGDAVVDLEGVSHSVNGGNIQLTVRGSPGTADEETESVNLDGTLGYDLAWSREHTDYEVEVTLTSASGQVTDSPELGGLTLAQPDPGESAASATKTVTTDLPAPTIEAIDDAVEGELTISYALGDNSTDGDVLVERSTDGGSTWADAGTITDLSQDTLTDSGLLDGVIHTYRLTRRTDHASTQSGTASAQTILPAPTSLQVTSVGAMTIPLDWVSNANNGTQRVEYRQSDVGGSPGAWTTGPSGLDVGTESATVSGLKTGEEYDLRVAVVTTDATTYDTT